MDPCTVEQHALRNVNNCWNTNIPFYLETSDGQNSKSKFIFSISVLIRHLWQLRTVIFLLYCLIWAVLLLKQITIGIYIFEKINLVFLKTQHKSKHTEALTSNVALIVIYNWLFIAWPLWSMSSTVNNCNLQLLRNRLTCFENTPWKLALIFGVRTKIS